MTIPMRVYVYSGDCEETFRKDMRCRTGQVALHEIPASLTSGFDISWPAKAVIKYNIKIAQGMLSKRHVPEPASNLHIVSISFFILKPKRSNFQHGALLHWFGVK